MHDTLIIGAGAAGLATASFLARRDPLRSIVLLDGARTIGAKILVSGGGRCNVTNREVLTRDFNGGDRRFIERILRRFTVADTLAWFADLGVAVHEEARGKLFPDSNKARTVLDALVRDAMTRGVSVRPGHRVSTVTREAEGFRVETSAGELLARQVVLATGGLSLPKSGSDGHGYELARRLGHTIVPTTPALVPLLLADGMGKPLAGVSQDVRVTVAAPGGARDTASGPMLWTHVGVSGPAILDASRHWLRHQLEGREPVLTVDLAGESFAQVETWLLEAARARPRATVANVLHDRLPAAVAAWLAERAAVAEVTLATLPREGRRRLVRDLTELALPVTGSRGYTHAEVTAGGVELREVDPATLQSRRCAGLYLVGEILDVDGRLGGFNFQWAWSSAAVAAAGIRGRD